MGVPVYMLAYHMHAWSVQRLEEGARFPRTEVTDGSKKICGFWELKTGFPEQPLLLTAEPPLQPLKLSLFSEDYLSCCVRGTLV